LKRKSHHFSDEDDNAGNNIGDQSRVAVQMEDIYLQPNFEKHTNLFQDFKNIQFAACLKRHAISLEQFEELMQESSELRDQFDQLIHFPFVGLVKEKGQTSFEGAAILARPPSLKISIT